jgi:GxxExxY protein
MNLAPDSNIVSDILYKQESYQIIGACFAVYDEMGCGFLEAVYQECLELEFKRLKLPALPKAKLALQYRGDPLTQRYEVDFLCFDKIIVELKAADKLAKEHHAQVINYLKVTGKKLGLLVNFGHYPGLEYQRILNAPPDHGDAVQQQNNFQK